MITKDVHIYICMIEIAASGWWTPTIIIGKMATSYGSQLTEKCKKQGCLQQT